MPKQQYKTYSKIFINGTQTYINGVSGCLDQIATTPDGGKLLTALCSTIFEATIRHTDSGNSCARDNDDAFPKLVRAIGDKAQVDFQNELTTSLERAKGRGITLEHLARQLVMGLSPATYKTIENVVRPNTPSNLSNVKPQDYMMTVALQTADIMQMLKDLASGKVPLTKLPDGWQNDLPRLLRNHLTPGTGCSATVKFHTTKTFHCVDDPAMHQRPPAIGLAHELIHVYHCMTGVNMRSIATAKAERLEEIITTGFPPYNYEEFSDNKIRTQWETKLELRQNY